MQNWQMFSIYDKKAKAFTTPFFQVNDATATRTFFNLCNDPNSQLNQNPEDYQLHHVGEFIDATGEFSLCEGSPIQICTGFDVMAADSKTANVNKEKKK